MNQQSSTPVQEAPSGISPELEARFIEQEHRVVRVVQTYFGRNKWVADDPRRVAARNALIWRVFSPGTAAVAAGGLIALGSLVALVYQTFLIAKQNDYFKEQNEKIQTQIDQQADSDLGRRRTEIIAALYETQPGQHGGGLEARYNPRTRGEAVAEFIQLERLRIARLQKKLPQYQSQLSLTQARLDKLNLDNMDLAGLSLVGAFLQQSSFHRVNLEGADFRAALFDHTSFVRAQLANADFSRSNLLNVSFERADLRNALFAGASFQGANFSHADMRGADLTGLLEMKDTDFQMANIWGVKGVDPERLQSLKSAGAVEIESDLVWNEANKQVPSR